MVDLRVISKTSSFRLTPQGERVDLSFVTVQDETGTLFTVRIEKKDPSPADIKAAVEAKIKAMADETLVGKTIKV